MINKQKKNKNNWQQKFVACKMSKAKFKIY